MADPSDSQGDSAAQNEPPIPLDVETNPNGIAKTPAAPLLALGVGLTLSRTPACARELR